MERLNHIDATHVRTVYKIAQESFAKHYHFNGDVNELAKDYTTELVAVVLPTLEEYLQPYVARLGVNPAKAVMQSLHLSAIKRIVHLLKKK